MIFQKLNKSKGPFSLLSVSIQIIMIRIVFSELLSHPVSNFEILVKIFNPIQRMGMAPPMVFRSYIVNFLGYQPDFLLLGKASE